MAVSRQHTACFPKPDGALQVIVLYSNVNHRLQELDRQLEYRHCKHKCRTNFCIIIGVLLERWEVQQTCAMILAKVDLAAPNAVAYIRSVMRIQVT